MSDTPKWIGRKPLPKEAESKPPSILDAAFAVLSETPGMTLGAGETLVPTLIPAILIAQALDRHAKALIEASAIARSGHGS